MSKHQEICFENYDECCTNCSTNENIEVHHIDGRASNNSGNNLIPLCKSCHMKVHRGINEREEYVRLRSHLPESSIVPHAPRSGVNMKPVYVRPPVYELLTQLTDEYDYSSKGNAVDKLVFEAGYDV